MFQKGPPRDTFFNMKALAPRPLSEATEMFDTDFEDDMSDIEDNSPRFSLNSAGRRSETTLSSFEEIHTPISNEFQGFNFEIETAKKSVEGPRGPHLFRSSTDSSLGSQDDQYVLGMSPMTPRVSSRPPTAFKAPEVPEIPSHHRPISTLTDAVEYLDLREVAQWTPRQVARWMYDAGFEPSIVEKFEDNDISGASLITLKFEDLRELDIPSFGKRTKVWNEIHVLRGSAPSTPKPTTPIDEKSQDCLSDDDATIQPRRHKSSRRKHRKRSAEDIITPLESVSIVGIEQLMPKQHKCAKGENCSKWRKQQRLIDTFKKEHPVSPEGGAILIAGDPGNPLTATSTRPFSDAVPSVVASSDVLGPSTTEPLPAFRHLEEASLRNVQSRDPQDNVKQFIKFQHMNPSNPPQWSPSEEPPTPPYEMFPALPNPHSNLRSLPKLAIPSHAPLRPAPPRSASANAFSPYRMERVEAMSPDLRSATQSPSTVYRFGTPFSEMDVPVTSIQLGPISRDASQSVPPDMSYRNGPPLASTNINNTPLARSQSRSSARRPSFPAMPRVDENSSTTATPVQQHQYPYPQNQQNQPWTAAPLPKPGPNDPAHQGPMHKRRTRLLRHEWHEHHFTLRGTRLAMHKDARCLETLEYIDVDDYAIACSSLASGGKLGAAFKAMNISLGKGMGGKGGKEGDVAAFSFQLIPGAIEKGR